MTDAALHVDPLRETLLAPELAEARRRLGNEGLEALITLAGEAVRAADLARTRLGGLTSQLARCAPAERVGIVARYLRETVQEPGQLRVDLRELERRREGFLDAAVLTERMLRQSDSEERRAEAALAIAGRAVAAEHALDSSGVVEALCALARAQGRWSRRREALRLLTRLARRGLPSPEQHAAADVARALFVPTEQRWLQAPALTLLVSVNGAQAFSLARERFVAALGSDDFIARDSILRALACLREPVLLRDLLPLAHRDSTELVRMTAARVERDIEVLTEIALHGTSGKVRAIALIYLRKRRGVKGLTSLLQALTSDADALVVETAAHEVTALARRGGLPGSTHLRALLAAATRNDLPPTARTACETALLVCDVLGDEATRDVFHALTPIVREAPVGGRAELSVQVLAHVNDAALARVLAVLANDDFALGVDRTEHAAVLHRGEQRKLAPWRVLFELTRPTPSKRQGFEHAIGKRPRGALRAPPGGMAELAATRVPGERVLIDSVGGWGRYLPLVDDLLSTGVFLARRVALTSLHGVTTLTPARGLSKRLRAFRRLSVDYAALSELRRRALAAHEPEIKAAYVREIEQRLDIQVSFSPHELGGTSALSLPVPMELAKTQSEPSVPSAATRTMLGLAVLGSGTTDALRDLWQDLVVYASSPGGNRLAHLSAYAVTLLFGLTLRNLSIRHAIDRDRAAMPLVIGGWGTRGKSGTERLKAAMFQGMGHECLVKTTGCEAMFIHALPGAPAREIFLYRAYDKATVWEQRDVLSLARRIGARVFLWECMALQPDLVNLLQAQWMRDDFSTITNAYPDHEDVQGPTGFDVATVISEFVPTHGRLFTTEDQMLPLLRQRANERGTPLCAVRAREASLLPDDLLARFSYQEHPNNIALVASLARHLGIDPTQAIVEMADNVVPDLGVLKTYPDVSWCGRTLSFTNGMSANERTGALSNWRRAGFDAHEPEAEPARFLVTVVNNRADRVARSEVFARVIVEDLSAHKHVLIGTNVTGLLGFIDVALEDWLASLALTGELHGSPSERLATVRERIDRAFARLKVAGTDTGSVLRQWRALGMREADPARIESLLTPRAPEETYDQALQAVTTGLERWEDPEQHEFAARSLARRRAVRAVHASAERLLESAPARLEALFGSTYRALFQETLVPCHDASQSGDATIEAIALQVPRGARASIMGIQNIKGTGLDFVYRWVSIDTVDRMLRALASPSREQRTQALTQLLAHDDYGMVDSQHALGVVSEARTQDPHAGELPYDALIARLRDVADKRAGRARAKQRRRLADRLRGVVGETLDFIDAVGRRSMADDVQEALLRGHLSHSTAAVRMRDIMARSKGAFMRRR